MIKYLGTHRPLLKNNTFILLPFTRQTNGACLMDQYIFYSTVAFFNKRLTVVELQASNAC